MIVYGHGLQAEGQPFESDGRRSRDGSGRALCRCGEMSEPLSKIASRKRWHEAHKAEVLEQRGGPINTWANRMPTMMYAGSCVDCHISFAAYSLAVHQKRQHGRRWPVRGIIPRWFMLPEEDRP